MDVSLTKGRIANLRLVSAFIVIIIGTPATGQEHNWHSHAEVARKVVQVFEEMKSYRADFSITTVDGKRTRSMRGTCYYQKPDRVRFSFQEPAGDFILSDGKTLWVYVRRENAVGRQDLELDVKNENNKPVFTTAGPGLARLFRKYHYRFDTVKQPKTLDGRDVFVMDMEQREKIGGYEKIRLFIDAKSYLIHRAEASDGYGKQTTITFANQKTGIPLEGKLFHYEPGDNVRVVSNPLVDEE